MTKVYDWIVVGAGITGAALGYELVKKGFSVLLVERDAIADNATRYSYGGLAYWSGTSELTQQLCAEGIERHRQLSAELDADTEFRELDLILTVDATDDPQAVAASSAQFGIPPRLISVEEAGELEPLLNPRSISAALTVKHGCIHAEATANAYCQAMQRYGGEIQFATVLELVREGSRINGVRTNQETYKAANTVICAGGMSRHILQLAGIPVRVYFTHAELIETAPVEPMLRTIVMPARQRRFDLEAKASADEVDEVWNEAGNEVVSPIFDAGAVQLRDRRIRLGQISRALTDVSAICDRATSEATIREGIAKILPSLATLPGTWHSCLVAFGVNRLPVVGAVPNFEGIYVFSGFTNPLVFVPPLAQRFANFVGEEADSIIPQLAPQH